MQYPNDLVPCGIEEIHLPSGRIIIIQKTAPRFREWSLPNNEYSFGNKAFIEYKGEALFAEVVVLRIFLESGWQARWVQTYGAARMNPRFLISWANSRLKNQANHSIDNRAVLNKIQEIAIQNNHSYSGCPDVIAWKDNDILFVELKRKGKDRIRKTQTSWLEAAMLKGMKEENFLIAEWDIDQDKE